MLPSDTQTCGAHKVTLIWAQTFLLDPMLSMSTLYLDISVKAQIWFVGDEANRFWGLSLGDQRKP